MSQPYLSLEAAWHDAFWATEGDASELPLMREFLDHHPGAALEIGCGSGRLLLPLLAEGHAVEGLELSPDMIALARERAQRNGLSPVIHEADMSAWQPGHRYSALLAPAFTLQLAENPAATLRHWNGWLEPGGGLYLTTFIPYAELLGELPENKWYPDHEAILEDGRRARITTRHRIDRERQQIHREHRYSLAGDSQTTHTSRQTIRWIEHGEMLDLLTGCGFSLDRCLLDFDFPHPPASPLPEDFQGILTYIGRKQSPA